MPAPNSFRWIPSTTALISACAPGLRSGSNQTDSHRFRWSVPDDAARRLSNWVTPADALKHPTWKMGNRITIDSATLMNKGFEVIEACWLFDFSPDDVEVVVHPQSTVHAMVEYNDGSVIAQVSATDMRMPIQYALTWPERAQAPVPKIDWSEARQWEFHRARLCEISAPGSGLSRRRATAARPHAS